MERRLLKLLPYGYGLEALVLLMAYIESYGDTPAFFQAAARLSGRVSLLFFLILGIYATVYPALPSNTEGGVNPDNFVERDTQTEKERLTLKVKTSLSKDFAIVHVIHWMFLAVAIALSGFDIIPIRVLGGALAYAMIIVMPLVYEKRLFANKPLPFLENGYIIYVWFIFFMTYWPRIFGNAPKATGNLSSYIVFMVLTVAFMVWRVVFVMRKNEVART
jgi:hypothetical protein